MKLISPYKYGSGSVVAPFTGAWIETSLNKHLARY